MKSIIVYSTDCPKCKQLKRFLDEKGIVYEINTDIAEMQRLGIKQAPVLQVDNQFFDFARAWAWIRNYEN